MKQKAKFSFIFLLFSAFSLLLFSFPSRAYVSFTFSYSIVPTTIQPGTKANVLLTINNLGTDFAGRTQLIVKSTPYITPEISSFDLQIIKAGGTAQVVIPITISQNAPEGTAVLPFTISYNIADSAGTVSSDGSISILILKRTLIQIVDVEYDKPMIQRGDSIEMTLTIQNTGYGEIKDLSVSIRNFSLPIAPAGTDTEKFLGSLSSGERTNVTFGLIINTNADTIAYSVPVSLSYYDDQGNPHLETKYAGLKIIGVPDFVISLEREENMLAGSVGKLSISISNTGTGSAKFLTLYADSGADVLPKSNYIGNMDPDDTNSIVLEVSPTSVGKQELDFTLVYRDSYNQQFTKSYTLDYTVYQKQIQFPIQYQIILILAVLAIVYWKRNSIIKLIRR